MGCVLAQIQAKMELRDLCSRRAGGAAWSAVSEVRGLGKRVRGSPGRLTQLVFAECLQCARLSSRLWRLWALTC